MNNSEYIIDIAKRYKDGKLSKQMFYKYFECAINCFEYELKPPKDIGEAMKLAAEFYSLMTNLYLIMSQPKPNPNPRFLKNNREEEVILINGKLCTPNVQQMPEISKLIKMKRIRRKSGNVDKLKQRQLIQDIMSADEVHGLYADEAICPKCGADETGYDVFFKRSKCYICRHMW